MFAQHTASTSYIQ